jgi:flagellar secretion chaperone FliS
MFPNAQSGASAYASVGVTTGIMGASQHKLVAMLYEGARRAIAQARMHLQAGNVAPRGEAISKAMRIIENGLQSALNKEAGGEIAARLDALYSYMTRRLLEANIKKSEEMLIEVDGLLATLEKAWLSIAAEAERIAAAQAGTGSRPLTR